jgi:dsRNA-specific ribonuclease
VGGRSFGPGTGKSKKRAEQVAAHIAWDALSDGDWSAGAVPEADMSEERN